MKADRIKEIRDGANRAKSRKYNTMMMIPGHVLELLRRDEAGHRVVLGRGCQVLTNGQDVAAGGAKVTQDFCDLPGPLAHAHHQAALDERSAGPMPAGTGQHGKAAPIVRLGPDRPVQPRHRLDIVVEHVRSGGHGRVDGRWIPLEVRSEDFDGRSRQHISHGPDDIGELPRPAVEQVVPRDRRNDDMSQAEPTGGVGHPLRLVRVNGRRRPVGGYGAESAGAGAAIAEDHERQRPPGKALRGVGAPGVQTDRAEALPPDQAPHGAGAGGQRPAQPLGQPAWRSRGLCLPTHGRCS